jgi:hypothetical protein
MTTVARVVCRTPSLTVSPHVTRTVPDTGWAIDLGLALVEFERMTVGPSTWTQR